MKITLNRFILNEDSAQFVYCFLTPKNLHIFLEDSKIYNPLFTSTYKLQKDNTAYSDNICRLKFKTSELVRSFKYIKATKEGGVTSYQHKDGDVRGLKPFVENIVITDDHENKGDYFSHDYLLQLFQLANSESIDIGFTKSWEK